MLVREKFEYEFFDEEIKLEIPIYEEFKDGKLGDMVKVVKTTLGSNGVSIGDIGIITTIIPNSGYNLHIPTKNIIEWKCIYSDVEKYTGSVIPDTIKDKMELCESMVRGSMYNRAILDLNKVSLIDEQIANIKILLQDLEKSKNEKITTPKSLPIFKESFIKEEANLLLGIVDKIENIDVSPFGLVIDTAPVVLKWSPSSAIKAINVNMGRYKIIIKGNDCNKIEIYNKDRAIGGYDHPHISGGKPCFGSYIEPINKLMNNKYSLGGLLILLLDYLSSCYKAGWYVSIDLWIEDLDKRCGRCYQIKKDCECDKMICGLCKKDIENCNCNVCALTGKKYRDNCKDDVCIAFSRLHNNCMFNNIQVNNKEIKFEDIFGDKKLCNNFLKELNKEKENNNKKIRDLRFTLIGGTK